MTAQTRIWTSEDAQLLAKLREEAELDVSILAKRHSLSVHQVRQLEEGGDTHFYSQAIKLQVGRKLLRSLGGDLVALPELADTDDKTDTSLALATQPIATASALITTPQASNDLPKSPSRIWIPLGGLVLVLMAWLGWQQAASNVNPQKKTFESVVEAPEAAPKAVVSASEAVSSVAVSVPNAASSPDQSIQQSPPIQSNAPSVISQAAASEPLTSTEDFARSSQCNFGADPVRVSVFEPQKPGNYVYFEAQEAVKLCVRDAAKQTTLVELSAGRGRTVRGAAPFEVLSENFANIRIFYQGKLVAPGLLTQAHVQLNPQAVVASATEVSN